MISFTREQRLAAYRDLTEAERASCSADSIGEKITEVGEKHNLSEEDLDTLRLSVGLYLLKLVPEDGLLYVIAERLPHQPAGNILADIKAIVFPEIERFVAEYKPEPEEIPEDSEEESGDESVDPPSPTPKVGATADKSASITSAPALNESAMRKIIQEEIFARMKEVTDREAAEKKRLQEEIEKLRAEAQEAKKKLEQANSQGSSQTSSVVSFSSNSEHSNQNSNRPHSFNQKNASHFGPHISTDNIFSPTPTPKVGATESTVKPARPVQDIKVAPQQNVAQRVPSQQGRPTNLPNNLPTGQGPEPVSVKPNPVAITKQAPAPAQISTPRQTPVTPQSVTRPQPTTTPPKPGLSAVSVKPNPAAPSLVSTTVGEHNLADLNKADILQAVENPKGKRAPQANILADGSRDERFLKTDAFAQQLKNVITTPKAEKVLSIKKPLPVNTSLPREQLYPAGKDPYRENI